MNAEKPNQGQRAAWDFDEWARLAREEPIAFERQRRALIRETIAQAETASRHRLRCLQWRIDMERDRSADALAACVRIYRMMWSSFAGDRGLVSALHTACGIATTVPAPKWTDAHVLAFKSKARKPQPRTGS